MVYFTFIFARFLLYVFTAYPLRNSDRNEQKDRAQSCVNTNVNPHRSKRISQREIIMVLPEWFDANYSLVFQLLKTNAYSNFSTIKTFLVAALCDIACSEEEREKTPVKHVNVKVTDKGINEGYQYVSVEIYPIMKDGTMYRIDKSCKVKIRPKMEKD